MTEVWRPVQGFPYEVSDLGRVRRSVGDGRNAVAGHVLSPNNIGGYRQVSLLREGRTHYRKVHHLVAEAFIGPRPPGAQIRHLDGNPGNNVPANLRWGTAAENSADRVAHGRQVRGETSPRARLTNANAKLIRQDYWAHRAPGSQRVRRGWLERTARNYGLDKSSIIRIVRGETYQ